MSTDPQAAQKTVPNMLQQVSEIVSGMQERFQQMSDEMMEKIDKMNDRIESIEGSLNSLVKDLDDVPKASNSQDVERSANAAPDSNSQD